MAHFLGPTAVFVTVMILAHHHSLCYPPNKNLLQCDPMEHKYYRAQLGVCGDCDKCFPGDELVPIELIIHINKSEHTNKVLPYKGEHRIDRFNTEFLAFTAFSLTLLFIVVLTVYCFWKKKKYREVSIKASEITRRNHPPKRDMCVYTDSSLQDIQEERSDDDEDDTSVFRYKTTSNRQREERDLKEPLLRRRQSFQIGYSGTGFKLDPPQIHISRQLSNSKVNEKGNLARDDELRRRKSEPVTVTEFDSCHSSLCRHAPSDSFIRYLSIVLAGDRDYRLFAIKVGLEEFNIKLIETEFEGRTVADVSYEVIKRVLQIKPKLRVIDIYDALDKLGFQNARQSLMEKIEHFKIPLHNK
ncbi:uncharacterized protein LOC132547295 [Ylistrum balloti]|uniref:uncharacterized protein LOC132547295 n=1 Tax=Ylistrum balloti TaxID=509963 RepID=UPI002905D495|nr:uncharacterized protein LOC132547295 [Ylistrum balloti]